MIFACCGRPTGDPALLVPEGALPTELTAEEQRLLDAANTNGTGAVPVGVEEDEEDEYVTYGDDGGEGGNDGLLDGLPGDGAVPRLVSDVGGTEQACQAVC